MNKRNTRTRCKLCSKLKPYSSACTVGFKQINVFWKPVLCHCIYIGAERRHRSTVAIVDLEHITLSVVYFAAT